MSNPYVQDIHDVAARVSDLANYRFLGVSAAATVTGFFVDINNVQCANAFSATVAAANGTVTPVSFVDLSGAALPSAACGAVIGIAGAYLSLGLMGSDAAMLTHMKTAAANYPYLAPTTLRGLGRVG